MKKADVIIFGGQSNMQGQTERLSESEIVENALEYKWMADFLTPLKNPVGESVTINKTPGYGPFINCPAHPWLEEHVFGAACYGYTNMVPSFCRTYIKETGNDVIAVHAAKGSTKISYWLPGTIGFECIKEKSLGAIKKAKEEFEIGNIFFVWLQGESDACASVKKDEYKEMLISLWEGLKEFGVNKFGIVRVGRFAGDERDDEIINAQEEICEENETFVMLTRETERISKIPEYMSPTFAGHYSAKGQELLGEKAAETFASLLK